MVWLICCSLKLCQHDLMWMDVIFVVFCSSNYLRIYYETIRVLFVFLWDGASKTDDYNSKINSNNNDENDISRHNDKNNNKYNHIILTTIMNTIMIMAVAMTVTVTMIIVAVILMIMIIIMMMTMTTMMMMMIHIREILIFSWTNLCSIEFYILVLQILVFKMIYPFH